MAKIRGSDVYVVEDIERILAALAGAARRYSGEYGAGYADALRDLADDERVQCNDAELGRFRLPPAAPEPAISSPRSSSGRA